MSRPLLVVNRSAYVMSTRVLARSVGHLHKSGLSALVYPWLHEKPRSRCNDFWKLVIDEEEDE